ncbi:hypothetical protein BGZ63DRAFT_423233 [Mariannaea sp. PMI_226]|nr:hypothetical protein BGZ63DRAFT_423233 [Mariannaea sp. PMI_226]
MSERHSNAQRNRRAGFPYSLPRLVNADDPIVSIENNDSSPDSDSSTATGDVPLICTPSTSASPQLSPRAQTRTATSEDLATRSMERNMQQMQLFRRDGIENMSDIAEAVEGIARGSDSRSASLAPEDTAGSRQATPRRTSRARRSGSRTLFTRHNVQDEEPPRDAFNDPSFQQAFRDAKRLMARMHRELGSSSIHSDPDSTMQRLHKEAGELANFTYPSTRTVGFVGDSGVGKSSLLNSLLDFKGLARTSNSGEACTCVVTEYHFQEGNSFDIEVELFPTEEINEQLSVMLAAYRHFHLHLDEMDPTERKESDERATQALHTFQAMFNGRLNNEEMLLKGSETRVLNRLKVWAADARPSGISHRQSTNSLKSCSARLMGLSSEPSSSTEPSKWPFIRKIRVFLNAHILSKGLVLVDLPGLRDLNSARRSITEKYLLECHEILVICNLGRAVTDEGVECVFRLAEAAQLSNMGIICTRSDDIEADEAKRDWRGGKARKIETLQDVIAESEESKSKNDAEIAEYELDDELLAEEQEYLFSLHKTQRTLNKKIEDYKFRLHAYLVMTRNSVVTNKLRTQYTRPGFDGELKIFCVSNKDYWLNRETDRGPELPALRLSGILEMRKHCISIVASSQRRITTRYMKDKIPALLAQIELWVRSGAGTADAERKETIRRNLNHLKVHLERDLTSDTSRLRLASTVLKNDFNEQIYQMRNISDWSSAARQAGYEWAGWHHASYSAFCRNFGSHYTATIGRRNWNEEAIEEMTSDLQVPCSNFRNSINHREDEIKTLLDELMRWTINHLEDNLSDMPEIAPPLIKALVSQKEIMSSNIEQIYETFRTSFRILRTQALSGVQTSFIAAELNGAYKSCIRESGRGSDARRKAFINGKLADKELFKNLMRSFRDRSHDLADVVQEGVYRARASYLRDANLTLDIILDDNVALESEQDPEFRRRVEEAVQNEKEEIERIKVVISVQE